VPRPDAAVKEQKAGGSPGPRGFIRLEIRVIWSRPRFLPTDRFR